MYEDDGVAAETDISRFTNEYSANDEEVAVSLAARNERGYTPVWKEVVIVLPVGDKRAVTSPSGQIVQPLEDDDSGRARYKLPAPSAKNTPPVANGVHA